MFKVKYCNTSHNTYKLNDIDGRSKYSADNIIHSNNGHTLSGFFSQRIIFLIDFKSQGCV